MSRESNISHITDIFGSSIIVPLVLLLPSVKDVPEPPTLPSNQINSYKAYAKTINYFLQNDEKAIGIALKDCVDISLKLVMFMCYRGDKILQDGTVNSLIKLSSDEYSKSLLINFIDKYGDINHKISKTSVRNEIKQFETLATVLKITK
eukprot:GHVR01051707.1.p1 GENE.GHVR01051707.1~~GHVR01051707.1.p1  ORF type:complete len:149 (-),score=12.00 GHVR01051707.1:6-452(-)